MNTGITASGRIFTILNVLSVKSLLNGAIYLEEPLSELVYQKCNISIFPLTTSMDYLKEHVVNVNIFCPDLPSGQTDLDKLGQIGDAVITTLKAYRAVNDYFQLEVIANNLIKDENNRSYLNIRLEVTSE